MPSARMRRGSPRHRGRTHPADGLPPDDGGCSSPSTWPSSKPGAAPSGRTITYRLGRPSFVRAGESCTNWKPGTSTNKLMAGSYSLTTIAARPRHTSAGYELPTPVSAENLCHQAIFVDDATNAVVPPDPEMIQVGDAIWQRPQWRGLVQSAVRPVGIVEVLVLLQHHHQVAPVPDQGPVQQLASAAANPPLHDRIAPYRQLHPIRMIGTGLSG
jgi:hypothetical protein